LGGNILSNPDGASMKELLVLGVLAGLAALNIGCDSGTGTKKSETTKEVKKDGKVEKTTETKESKTEDGKVIEKKEEKKVESK
jgi:hypothetical protein